MTIAGIWTGVLVLGGVALLGAGEPGSAKDAKWTLARPEIRKKPEKAGNSYCLVCHIALEDEELVASHQPWSIGCEACHGTSDEHSSDEDGLTAPDIM